MKTIASFASSTTTCGARLDQKGKLKPMLRLREMKDTLAQLMEDVVNLTRTVSRGQGGHHRPGGPHPPNYPDHNFTFPGPSLRGRTQGWRGLQSSSCCCSNYNLKIKLVQAWSNLLVPGVLSCVLYWWQTCLVFAWPNQPVIPSKTGVIPPRTQIR